MGKLARFARSPGLSFAALTPGTRSPAALSGTVARLWLAPGNRESGIGILDEHGGSGFILCRILVHRCKSRIC